MVRGTKKQWRNKGSKPRAGAPKPFKRGSGVRGRRGAPKAKSSEELNLELEMYWGGDKGGKFLDKDMENYWKAKSGL